MSTRNKVVLGGAVVLAVVAVFCVYRVFASPLSSKRISIVMHDPETLQADPTGEPLFLKCSIQLPKECAPVDARGYCIVAKSKAIYIDITMHQEQKVDPDFKAYVAQQRGYLSTSPEKPQIDEEGRTTIDGHNAYVLTYHFTNVTKVPVKTRHVYVEAPESKFFDIRFACDEADWDAKRDIMDSSISTFRIDSNR